MLFRMDATVHSRTGFILAGGKSTRMGSDKAFVEFGGQTLLDRATKVMSEACETVTIVGDPAKFAEYAEAKKLAVVSDIFPGCGPLAGIHAALTHSSAELNLMLAVDMPHVTAELLKFLFAAAEKNNAVVTVPRTTQGLQPLCAIYRREFQSVAELALRAGKYKIDAAFSDISTHIIDEAELAKSGFAEQNFFNVNTPQDRVVS